MNLVQNTREQKTENSFFYLILKRKQEKNCFVLLIGLIKSINKTISIFVPFSKIHLEEVIYIRIQSTKLHFKTWRRLLWNCQRKEFCIQDKLFQLKRR